MQLVDHDTFLSRLSELFESTKTSGSVWLTHKRLTHDGEDATMGEAGAVGDDREYPCLVRVTNGDQTFSTRVGPGQLDKFHSAYGALLKSSMTTLRKRDKQREKQKADKLAKRKQRLAEPIPIEGPKRGNGRKKRQRRIKAAMKQEQARKKAEEREEGRSKVKTQVVP
ncbi:signal recognition particle, SRP9/SRP14 subunit [Gloeophyllum trabeum ATCC 11539]|uniref:Signal recognition particle subunit SRP14 n=1 Tax=Gloeophyllum trabeum (strain ATCC 11539 / FP-39264 / Madison 617) TaxID=670483 RepID=S7QKA2_GLOTA|nr:signal recognition particle, SRP9/SRP14 subunit [Gloeophyllum trabeum ATCC 11539]EPQ60176.1 signal recognition particle, SRP9/SRP14 subunit [Gloeophyllum trabeum ATCC 11539]